MDQAVKKLNQDFKNLSQGEHSLEEVARLAGLVAEKTSNRNICPVCGIEGEVVEEEDYDPVNGFQVWRKMVCPKCGMTI